MMIWDGLSSGAISLFSLFSLFFNRIISEEALVFGGNPGLPQVQPLREQRERSLFPMFFRCSCANAYPR
jgi:hypothetical protein